MRTLDILFIIDPIEQLRLDTDTSFAMMAETDRRNHRLWMTTIDELRLDHGIPSAPLARLAISYGKAKSYRRLETKDSRLDAMDAIFMRKDPPMNLDFIMATSLLSLVDQKKTFVMNSPQALRDFNEKLGILKFPECIPETIVSKKYADFMKFLARHKTIVLKPLESFSGNEIIVLKHNDKNRRSVMEMLTHREKRYIMGQKYIPGVKHGDKRILILNGKILGQEVRIASPEDHRSNIFAGGTSHKTRLTAREREICETVGVSLNEQGIYFAGIDMIGGLITEINISSPAGLVEINAHEKAHLERDVLDFIESSVCANTSHSFA